MCQIMINSIKNRKKTYEYKATITLVDKIDWHCVNVSFTATPLIYTYAHVRKSV